MATDYQLTESFQKNKSDYIRPGEYIKIVAINRATGYMGTARVQLARSNLGDLTVLAPPIVLSPPHLKIWAERKYNVEQGITQGEARNYTIGTEGAALTSDTTITIYTEWLDEHGKPLPEELGLDNGEQYGFTGRLARVVAPNQLQGENSGSDLASFAIAPGRKTQVIKVGSNLTTAEHYYVHVIGKGKNQDCVGGGSCPSFTSLGFNAPYNHRPNLLVPFLVPLPDEDLTWQEYNNYRGLLADDTVINKPNKPLPAYSWAYRPEYQFSQYGLKIQEIKATAIDSNGKNQSTQILSSDSSIIASSDDYITAFYSLISSSFDRLTAIDGKQELVLALGEQEQIVTLGEDQSITFSNLKHLAQLTPEDFLTMRLYTNNDTSNILWEWAFTSDGLAVDSSQDAGSRENSSFIICGASAQGKNICQGQQAITANLILDFSPTDTIKWQVEAVIGSDCTAVGQCPFDDLDSGSNANNKPFSNGKIKSWEIGSYAPNVTAPTESGTGKFQDPWISKPILFSDAKFFSFYPDLSGELHTPSIYHGGTKPGTKKANVWRHNPHVAYKITATVNGQHTYTKTVKMDHQDVIRQEFINHISSVPGNISDVITVPIRDDLKSKKLLGNILEGDWGQPYYDYVYDKHLVLLASRTKKALLAQPTHTFNVPNAAQDSLPVGSTLKSKLKMNSAWRNPERNERITSNATSRHMVGRAVDLGASGVPLYGDNTTNRAKLLWQLWRASETTSAIDNGIQIRWILENANGSTSSMHGTVDSVFLLQGGTTVRTVPKVMDSTDIRGKTEGDSPDGIPDVFNRATHVHLESMPSRGVGL
jgi:hypothetical protein